MKNGPELFVLCQQVLERTGWITDLRCCQSGSYRKAGRDYGYFIYSEKEAERHHNFEAPFTMGYTSDYLLDKLPRLNGVGWVSITKLKDSYRAAWNRTSTQEYFAHESDTPLKALLKLVIALHEAGDVC